MSKNKKIIVQAVCLGVFVFMMGYGIYRGEVAVVFNKAVNVCLECIGLG